MNYNALPRRYWDEFRPNGIAPAPQLASSATAKIELWLVAAAVFLAPFNILRTDAFYFTASDAFALASVLAMVLKGSFPVAPMATGTLIWNTGIAFLSGALLLSSLIHGDAARGFITSAQYLFAYFLLTFVVLSRPWSETIVLIKTFLCSIGLMCLAGILVVDILKDRTSSFISGSGRFVGWVERENECAALIALSVPLVLWLVASGGGRRRWLLIALPLFSYGIMLTGSNTGLIGLVVAVAVSVVASGSWRRIITVAISSALLFFIVITWGSAFLPDAFQRRVLQAMENGDIDEAGTYVGRMKLIHEAVGKAGETGLLGIGADQYRVFSSLGAPVHNTYLLIWVEAGLIGFVGFILLLLAGFTVAMLAFRLPQGRASAICSLTTVFLFAALANAFPHLYARFMVMPLLLGIAPSVVLLRASLAGRLRISA